MGQAYLYPGFGGLALWASGLLPSAHLLDGTWWFDQSTVECFRSRLQQLPLDKLIVFLGTPSLFVDTLLSAPSRRAILFDRDEAIRECLPSDLALHNVTFDLTKSLPDRLGADLVIADPPWYMEEIEAFLAAAQGVARVGAKLQICIPPIGTRPGIKEERENLFAWAAAGGLRLISISCGQVGYDTPPFETNVFSSSGEPPPENRRTGDLATFTVEQLTGLIPREEPPAAHWAEVRLLNTRWRVAEIVQDGDDPTLVRMGFLKDVFPSCSRRHADRSRPTVWTSGNRAFLCSNTQGFLSILRSLRGNTVAEIASHAQQLYPNLESSQARAASQILTLIHIEEEEAEALKRCLNGRGP